MIRSTNGHDSGVSVGVHEPTVFVVDDNAEARRAVVDLAHSWGYRAEGWESAEAFFASHEHSRSGCLVTRDMLSDMTGLELLDRLRAEGVGLPVIVVSDEPNVPLAVRVMQHGALTLLEKSGQHQELREAIRGAIQQDVQRRKKLARQRELQRRLAHLTPVEMEVLELIIAGKANKNISRYQNVSLRTVETRRQQVFEKMEADSLAELILMVVEARTGETLPEHILPDRPLSRIE